MTPEEVAKKINEELGVIAELMAIHLY